MKGAQLNYSKDPPEYVQTRSSLDAAIKDQTAYGVSMGVTTTYMIPFAVALKVPPMLTTLIAFLPDLLGSTLQLCVTSLINFFKSRKKLLIILAFLEALTWLPLAVAPYMGASRIQMILISLILNNILLSLVEPLWSSLISDLVDEHQRGRYFGRRMKTLGFVTFVSTLSAAAILSFFSGINIFIGFSILFATAFITRLMSVYYLMKIKDVKYSHEPREDFTMLKFLRKINKTNFGRFMIVISLFDFAIALIGPFYIVYMQETLEFSYLSIMIIVLAQVLASYATMDFWGKTVDKHGSKKVLHITGILISIGPLGWIFVKDFMYLLIVELIAGVFMAGFKLAAANFVFDSTRPQARLKCLSYYNFFTSTATFIGAVFGSIVFILAQKIIGNPAILLFALAFALRILFAVTIIPYLKEERLLEIEIKRATSKYSLTVIPNHGVMYDVLGKYRMPISLGESKASLSSSPFAMEQKEKEKLTKRFVDRVVSNYGKKFQDY